MADMFLASLAAHGFVALCAIDLFLIGLFVWGIVDTVSFFVERRKAKKRAKEFTETT